MKFLNTFTSAVAAATLFVCLLATPSANARIFGTNPLNISTTPHGAAGNGDSGQPSVAGDNRRISFVAFFSDASNLVDGDSNGLRDVFVWHHPAGASGRRLNHLGVGHVERVSVSSQGVQANGPSENPSSDGSLQHRAHCVAFQSRATNLVRSDATPDWDIYVRNLHSHKTYLASRRSPGDAINPSISGNCRNVIYEAGGNIYRATVKGGHNDSLGSGSAPDYSLDGLSMVWVRDDHVIFRHHGHNRTFGSGNHPLVSDRSGPAGWAIGYDSGNSVKLAIVRNNGRTHERVIVENGVIGGVTAYAAQRGIVVFATGSSLFYLNRHTGNTDDLAHAYSAITEPAASARSNLVAFSASGGLGFVDPPLHPRQSVYVKYLPK